MANSKRARIFKKSGNNANIVTKVVKLLEKSVYSDKNKNELLKEILNHKINNVNIRDKNNIGNNIVGVTAKFGDVNFLTALKEGFEKNNESQIFNDLLVDVNNSKENALHIAIKHGNLEVVKYIVEQCELNIGTDVIDQTLLDVKTLDKNTKIKTDKIKNYLKEKFEQQSKAEVTPEETTPADEKGVETTDAEEESLSNEQDANSSVTPEVKTPVNHNTEETTSAKKESLPNEKATNSSVTPEVKTPTNKDAETAGAEKKELSNEKAANSSAKPEVTTPTDKDAETTGTDNVDAEKQKVNSTKEVVKTQQKTTATTPSVQTNNNPVDVTKNNKMGIRRRFISNILSPIAIAVAAPYMKLYSLGLSLAVNIIDYFANGKKLKSSVFNTFLEAATYFGACALCASFSISFGVIPIIAASAVANIFVNAVDQYTFDVLESSKFRDDLTASRNNNQQIISK